MKIFTQWNFSTLYATSIIRRYNYGLTCAVERLVAIKLRHTLL